VKPPASGSVWRKDVVSWSLYDFANTIYSMNIVSQYLKLYIVDDLGYDDRWFDIPFAVSMLLAAVFLPALGAMSDHATKKKLFLLLFTTSCCLAVAGFAVVPAGFIWVLMALFVVANFSYEAGQPFYNALLYSVAEGKQARFVSGLGVALGYVGSILGMLMVLPFVTGDLFGLAIPFIEGGGREAAFLPTMLLFAAFAVPVFVWVKERPVSLSGPMKLSTGYRDVWKTLRDSRKHPGALRFLIADYFFEDAAATIIVNIGVYCTLVIGMDDSARNLFLIVSTASAVVGSFVIGWIAPRWSLKKLLQLIVVGWIISLVLFVVSSNMTVIWVLGSLVGILLGGLWTVTRPLLAELVPHDQLGRYYGLFALSGRAAAVVGPLLWTTVIYFFRPDRTLGRMTSEWLGLEPDAAWLPYKVAVVTLAVIMLLGLFILRKVPDTDRGRPHAG